MARPRVKTIEMLGLAVSIIFAVSVPLAVIVLGASRRPELASNVVVGFVFRFATAYLIALPVAWKRRGLVGSQDAFHSGIGTRRKTYERCEVIFKVLLVVSIPAVLFSLIFQFMFGYVPALGHSPMRILGPVCAAIGLHMLLALLDGAISERRQQAQLAVSLLPWTLYVLLLITGPVLFLPPLKYEWYQDYLGGKYGVEMKDQYSMKMEIRSKSSVTQPDIPVGLAIRYLFFGERSVDLSILND